MSLKLIIDPEDVPRRKANFWLGYCVEGVTFNRTRDVALLRRRLLEDPALPDLLLWVATVTAAWVVENPGKLPDPKKELDGLL